MSPDRLQGTRPSVFLAGNLVPDGSAMHVANLPRTNHLKCPSGRHKRVMFAPEQINRTLYELDRCPEVVYFNPPGDSTAACVQSAIDSGRNCGSGAEG